MSQFIMFRIAALMLLASGVFVWAHDPFEGTATVRLRTNSIDLAVTLNGSTALSLCEGGDLKPARFSPELFENNLATFKKSAGSLYEISVAGNKLAAFETNAFLGRENDAEYRLRYPRPSGAINLKAAYLERLPREGYGAALTVLDMENNVVVGQKLLTGGDLAFEAPGPPMPRPINAMTTATNETIATTAAPTPPKPGPVPTFGDFLKFGIRHILTGYDHLLFLCGLLVVCRRIGKIAVIVTCFTIAHSVSLALAALNVATISSRIVEPTIAATIVFVGIENLARPGEPKHRWLVAFIFGLVHGFGFASALKAVGLGAHGTPLLLPLFSFNLGVEIGQLAVAAIFLPVLWQLRTLKMFERHGTMVVSIAVTVIGMYWLVQRLFFS
jgi:hydrogenase/urease accessory protein HupE